MGSDYKTYANEIMFYICYIIYMGIVSLPQVINYWNFDEDLYNTFMAKIISRN